jgi:outer membrane protein assembly factor BamD
MRKIFVLAVLISLVGCGRKAIVQAPTDLNEPDRVLYERAMREMHRNRYDTARQALSVLIAQYESSEFLPQAKYALAESFFQEGTKASLTQAEAEFRDYIILFPKTDLADDAQLKIAMTHVKQMEKPDRDSSQAILADRELKVMIEDYPDSPLLEEAKQKRRAVQEVLAESEYQIGSQYQMKKVYLAAATRYLQAYQQFPDYSRTDDLLFSLGECLLAANKTGQSGTFYSKLVSDYPLSRHTDKAKQRLKELSLPIPEVNPLALSRVNTIETRPAERGFFGSMFGVFRGGQSPVSTDTGAASIRRGNSGAAGEGPLTIDPKVVSPPSPPRSN